MTEIQPERRSPKFELIGGNVCLDFINTLDNRPSAQPKELLKTYFELVRFGEDTGILTQELAEFFLKNVRVMPEEAAEALRRAINLREAMYAVFSALIKGQTVPPLEMETLNVYIQDAAMHSRLVPREGRCEWRFDS